MCLFVCAERACVRACARVCVCGRAGGGEVCVRAVWCVFCVCVCVYVCVCVRNVRICVDGAVAGVGRGGEKCVFVKTRRTSAGHDLVG